MTADQIHTHGSHDKAESQQGNTPCGRAAGEDDLDPFPTDDDVRYEVTGGASDGRTSATTGDVSAAGDTPGAAEPGEELTASQAAGIPDEDIAWFTGHVHPGLRGQAPELARSERAARRDGYLFRWVHPWVCQFVRSGSGALIGSSGSVHLNEPPGTDPYARLIEAELTIFNCGSY